jgi:hypothetical protein
MDKFEIHNNYAVYEFTKKDKQRPITMQRQKLIASTCKMLKNVSQGLPLKGNSLKHPSISLNKALIATKKCKP